jgi:hypothetical protein
MYVLENTIKNIFTRFITKIVGRHPSRTGVPHFIPAQFVVSWGNCTQNLIELNLQTKSLENLPIAIYIALSFIPLAYKFRPQMQMQTK